VYRVEKLSMGGDTHTSASYEWLGWHDTRMILYLISLIHVNFMSHSYKSIICVTTLSGSY